MGGHGPISEQIVKSATSETQNNYFGRVYRISGYHTISQCRILMICTVGVFRGTFLRDSFSVDPPPPTPAPK